MKATILFLVVCFSCLSNAGDCIIDPAKVVVNMTAEPIFIPREEKNTREIASKIKEGREDAVVRSPDQYLDVLKELPFKDPSLSRVWLERRILNEN